VDIENRLMFEKGSDSYELGSIGEADVTDHYVKALQDQKSYIQNIQADISLEKQRAYVKKICLSKDDGILGLFLNGSLIGTSGVQNINGSGFTTFGIFVFDKEDRGKGYGKILVWASTCLLSQSLGCKQFSAGMEKTNIPSFKAFKACGYDILKETDDVYIVKINDSDLIVPEQISGVRLA